jgi:hypothetical protein
MPTVHCPTCQRALHLPEAVQGSTACCPLCRTSFPTPAEPPRVPERPSVASVPVQPWGAKEQRPDFPPGARTGDSTFDFNEPTEADELSLKDREAMRSAASWLRGFVIFATLHLISCGCVNVLALTGGVSGSIGCFIVTFAMQLVALILVFSSAESIARRRNRGLGLAGCFLTLVLSLVHVLLPLLALAAGPQGEPMFFLVSMGMAVAVAVIGTIAALRGLMILNKPEVIGYFQRRT